MKKQLILGASLLLGSMLGMTSCSNDSPGPLTPNTQTINTLFQQLKTAPQTFSVTVGTQQTIIGAKGTKITFHPGSFKDATGNTLTFGTVNIALIEMYTPGDMIANRVTTTTAAQNALTSGGAVNIKATLNGQEVFANSYSIAFKQDEHKEAPMALFRGYEVSDESGTNVKWNDDTTGTVPRTEKDQANEEFYYAFDTCTNFNWINCDYFYNAPNPKTDIIIVAPDASYNYSNTQIFIVFPGMNSVTTMYTYDAATHSFKFGYPSYYLPVGTSIKVAIFGAKNNSYYMDIHQPVTVTNGMTINFTPTTQTLSAIQTAISGL